MSADSGTLPERTSTTVWSVDAADVQDERDARRRLAELRAEVSFLRDELDRREQARQNVVDRYETILQKRREQSRREQPDGDSVALRMKRLVGLR
jgi:Glu-tRNA(Gln) amidotransferase subunit E-like FAD-binding protein